MAAKKLYNKEGNEFYPITHAEHVVCDAITVGSNVQRDIAQLNANVRTLLSQATGAQTVSGSLSVEIGYLKADTNQLSYASSGERQYVPEMPTPDEQGKYIWKRTIYWWQTTLNGEIHKDKVGTTYEIVATALYPETQVMYTVLPGTITDTVKGPGGFATNSTDQNPLNNAITWHNYFPGISPSTPYGYMATRHRDAGQNFPTEDYNGNTIQKWSISLFAMYPLSGN